MKRINYLWGFFIVFVCLFLCARANLSFSQTENELQLQQMVYSIDGLSNNQQQQLINKLTTLFQPIFSQRPLKPKILKNIASIISAGIFEGGTIDIVADLAYKAYLAQQNGAPEVYVRDLALIGVSTKITAHQLEAAAKAIEKLITARVDPMVTEEFIGYALYNGWNGDTIQQAASGLIAGVSQGLAAKRLALTLIISIDQQIAQRPASEIVTAAISFLKTADQQKPEEAERQKLAYEALQNAISQGLPRSLADEIYYTAIEDKWSPQIITAVYDGLVKGTKQGLSTEKLATSILVRLAQTEQVTSPAKLVEEEIRYVAGVEKKRKKLIQQDERKYKRKPLPQDYKQLSYLQPEPTPQRQKPVRYYNTTTRTSLNQRLMWQNIQEYLGPPPTPYRWGGTSRTGIDCSAFVMNIYSQQGIYLPRTSAQQYLVGTLVRGNLQFGDLVFFSKYGPAYQVTHVGLYIGGDKFVHSSASKGVTISSLNKRYYRLRYKGARRIVL